jgi:PAS domain S-box-containing protein
LSHSPADPAPSATRSRGAAAVLEALGAALAVPEPEEASARLLDGLQGVLGVCGGLVALRVGDSARVLTSRGLPAGWASQWEKTSRGDLPVVLARTVVREPLEAPPGLVDAVLKRSGVRGLLTLPLGRGEDPDGALVLASAAAEPFPDADLPALEAAASALACRLQVALLRGRGTDQGPVPGAEASRLPEGSWGSLPVARLDRDGTVRDASPVFARLLRLDAEGVAGATPARYLAAADVPRLLEALDRVASDAITAVPEVRPAASNDGSQSRAAFDLLLVRREERTLAFAFPSTVGAFLGHDAELGDALAQQPDLAILRIARDGRIVTWPRRAARILGWEDEEIRGRSMDVVLAPDDRGEWERRRRAAGGEDRGEWQVPLRARDGSAVPCALRPLLLNQAEEALVLLRDRRLGEASEKWLRWSRALLSVLGVSTVVLDPGGRIRELGAGWTLGSDRRVADWLGRHVADLFDTDRREVLDALRAAARTGEWTGTLVSGGLPVPLRLKAVRGAEGNLEALVGARLPGTPDDGRDLFRKIPVGMILLDPQFRIVETNPELRAVCGDRALPGDPAGLDVRSLALFQTREVQTALESLRGGRRLELADARVKAGDGGTVVVQMSGDELTDAQGRRSGYVLTVLGRTGRTDMERQLVRAQKMESIGNFASGLAHDFGSFVSVILGKAGVLRVKLPADRHIMRELEDIETAAQRAQHLAQELMKFARGGRNRVAPLQLNRLVQEVSSLIRTSVGSRVEVVFKLDDTVTSVEGDEVELQQMVLNLCLNARDAMPRGGRLTLETRPLSPVQVAAIGADGRGGVCLLVRDTGVGMAPDVMERIFEPFFSTKDDGSGTGLGLAMVYGIVRRHGGTIDVHSAPGAGTTFEIALPAAAAAPAESRDGRDILVVDDEPAFREMIRLILEEDGHRAHLAANGIEALKRLRSDYAGLDLVILDLRMPGVDGLEVLEELRELAPALPVLVATGYASEEEKAKAKAAGARKILEKPYRVADLRSALAEVLEPAEPGPAEEAGAASGGSDG